MTVDELIAELQDMKDVDPTVGGWQTTVSAHDFEGNEYECRVVDITRVTGPRCAQVRFRVTEWPTS